MFLEGKLHIVPMDLKASAEVEVRKLQDMVKELERQNELLRHTQNGSLGGGTRKRESLDLEEVTLINLNESADELEESWLYESPVKQATPVQKSINSLKWAKTVSAEGLEDVRKSLIDKLDDIEGQQEITKVRLFQKPEVNSSSPQPSLFFQPTSNPTNNSRPGKEINQLKPAEPLEREQLYSSPHSSLEDLDDEPQGPVLRRSAINKADPRIAVQRSQKFQIGSNSPQEIRRVANTSGKVMENQLDPSPTGSLEDFEDDFQGPVLRRSAINKESEAKTALQRSEKPMANSPLEHRRIVNTSSVTRRSISPAPDDNVRVQPRSRRSNLQAGGNGLGKDSLETSSQSSTDDLDEDTNDKAPVVKRSALALPKPSSEGLSKQLWYSGPISQMNRQTTKTNPAVGKVRRSASPSPDRRSKLPSKSGGVVRRSTGARGSMEDLLDYSDSAPVQRRSLPQIPTDSTRSRLARPEDTVEPRSQVKPRSKAQNVSGGPATPNNVVTRRSLLTSSSSGGGSAKNSKVVARRRAPPQSGQEQSLNDSWKDGCY